MIPFLNKQIIGSWFGISCYHILVLNWTRFQSFLELFFRQMSKNATPVADHSVCINVWTIYNAVFPPLLYFKIEDLTYHMLSEKKNEYICIWHWHLLHGPAAQLRLRTFASFQWKNFKGLQLVQVFLPPGSDWLALRGIYAMGLVQFFSHKLYIAICYGKGQN